MKEAVSNIIIDLSEIVDVVTHRRNSEENSSTENIITNNLFHGLEMMQFVCQEASKEMR